MKRSNLEKVRFQEKDAQDYKADPGGMHTFCCYRDLGIFEPRDTRRNHFVFPLDGNDVPAWLGRFNPYFLNYKVNKF